MHIRSNMTGHRWSAVVCFVFLGMLFLSLNTTDSTFQAKTNSTINTSRVPAGMIAIWTGSLASIPAGWTLCNGSSGTPDLKDRFPSCVDPLMGFEIGTTGGYATHSHICSEVPAHDHGGYTSLEPNHTHALPYVSSTGGTTHSVYLQGQYEAATITNNTSYISDHTHTLGITGNGGPTYSASTLPPYFKAAYVMATTQMYYLPLGIIVLWTGTIANIPMGWALCDGTAGTPNLLDKFIEGVSNGQDPGATGGSAMHSHVYDSRPDHNHVLDSVGTHSHEVKVTNVGVSASTYFPFVEHLTTSAAYVTSSDGLHDHTVPNYGVASASTNSTISLPPYYKVAFIQKVQTMAIIPKGIIAMWSHSVASIPVGWAVCNGYTGTPELAEFFMMSVGVSENPGAMGGSAGHLHSYTQICVHNHTISQAGEHSHSLTFVTEHPTGSAEPLAYQAFVGTDPTSDYQTEPAGEHRHTISSTGSAICETNPFSVFLFPPYCKLVFMMSTDEPPGVTSVELHNSITTANTNEDLASACIYNDLDGPETHVIYRFYLNGVEQPQYENLSVPHDYTNKSQVWYVTATPFDGIKYGLTVKSNNVTIINTKPVAGDAGITPLSPTTDSGLGLNWQYNDTDNDTERQAQIRWFKNNVSQPALNNYTFVSQGNLVYGDKWNASVEPYDGEELGARVWSQTVTIGNVNPEITQPGDISYQEGQPGNFITWNITDANVLGQNYSIFRNSVNVLNGTWTPGVAFNISVNELAGGSYTYLIIAPDGLGGQATDQVIINVNANPVITHSGDISYQIGQKGYVITWNVTDANVLGQNYSIYRNSVSIANDTWMPGLSFNTNVDGLGVGSYTFMIIARDGLGGQVTDTVIVTVTAIPSPPPATEGPGFAMILLGSLAGIAIVVLGTRKIRHE
jgi:microcystin-dependent protein